MMGEECESLRKQGFRHVLLRGFLGLVLLATFSYFSISCSTDLRDRKSVYTSETLKRIMIVPGILENVTIEESMQMAVDALNTRSDSDSWSFKIVPDFKYQTVGREDFERKRISANISSEISVANFLHYVSTAGRVGFDLAGRTIIVFGF